MPTVRDVARRAGVAPITVSRVVNDSGPVSPETRARVEAAIADLGYVPNRLARSLRSRRSDMLALVLTDITNPFWTTVARGAEDVASDAGYSVIFCNTDESQAKEERYLQVLLQRQVDGLLLVPAAGSAGAITLAREHGTPVVTVDRRVPGVEVDVVRGDSEGGAYELTRHLLALGHRHVAMLSGPRGVSTADDRVSGYRRALEEAGLGEAARVFYGEYTQESGFGMARAAVAAKPRVTALFAGSNFIAAGVLQVLWGMSLHVPADVSVVCFDDLPLPLASEPFLTAAVQPAYEMGRRAAELLLARLSGDGPGEAREVVLPVEVIVRRSSGQAREKEAS
jgi:LacI family transcriptional regulator